jgi:hypothetical protein
MWSYEENADFERLDSRLSSSHDSRLLDHQKQLRADSVAELA